MPKYERFEWRTGKYMAHNPPCINAVIGTKVKIMECRPLSKTKAFVVIEQKVD
jgi:small subunit ribosomal protein S17